jgi:hypothetical protein
LRSYRDSPEKQEICVWGVNNRLGQELPGQPQVAILCPPCDHGQNGAISLGSDSSPLLLVANRRPALEIRARRPYY